MCNNSIVAQKNPVGSLPVGATSLAQPKVNPRGLPTLFDAGNPASVASQQAPPRPPVSNPSDVGMGILGGGGDGDVTVDDFDKQLKQMGQGRAPYWSLYE